MGRQIISRIPHRGMTPEEWGAVIGNELVKIWTDAMSPAEREMWTLAHDAQGQLVPDRVPAALFRKLDLIILHQAETLGWRLTLSELVRFRMSEWDHAANGPDLFRRLGSAMARFARIVQRKELPPIEDPDAWQVKRETVEELRLILGRMRVNLAVRRTEPTRDEVLSLFSTSISDSPGSFPNLAANLDRWQRFFEENRVLRPILLGDRAGPAALYDQFLAWSTGWEPESLRQAISKLNPKL